jgi:HPt (histidine-containing phosphotransfer) domain-containing protein
MSKLKMINVDEALELIGGYEQIYKKLIKTFIENQKELIPQVKEALNENNLDEARRLVHSCKGISKNLGASHLYEIASQFEVAILNNVPYLNDYLQKFEMIFKQSYQELETLV